MATTTKSPETSRVSPTADQPGCDPTLSQRQMLGVDIALEIPINAPRDRVFDALVHDVDQWLRPPEAPGMRLTLEPRVGGRFYRDLSGDLGEGAGHFWGVVQVYKPDELLEISGPMFMSEPVINHVSFRLEDDADRTIVKFSHRAVGAIPDGVHTSARENWTAILTKGLKSHVERRH